MRNPRIIKQQGAFLVFVDTEIKEFLEKEKEDFSKKERKKYELLSNSNDEEEIYDKLTPVTKNLKKITEKITEKMTEKITEKIDKFGNLVSRYTIPKDNKIKILEELKSLDIHHGTLFPDLENYCIYQKKYK